MKNHATEEEEMTTISTHVAQNYNTCLYPIQQINLLILYSMVLMSILIAYIPSE